MKTRFFLSMVLSALLMAGVGCTTMQEATDTYENEDSGRRSSVYNDPFYNNFYGSPVLVRDAYTGRYFYVYPSNSISPMDAYRFENRWNNSRYYDNRYYSRPSAPRPQVSDEQIRQQREKLEESRKRILGRQN